MVENNSTMVNMVQTLLELFSTRASGVVSVEQGNATRRIGIREGRLVFTESDVPDEHLASVMVRTNLLSNVFLSDIEAAVKTGESTEQAILRISGMNVERLAEGLQEKAIGILAAILCLSECAIDISAEEKPEDRGFYPQSALPHLVLQAARRVAGEQSLTQFPLLDGWLLPTPYKAFRELPIDRCEAFAFSLVQEPLRVEELLSLLPGDENTAHEAIRVLLLLRLLRLEQSTELPRARMPGTEEQIQDPTSAHEAPLRKRANEEQKIDALLACFEGALPHKILGVAQTSGESAIKRAFLALAKSYHPDRFPGAEYSPEFRKKADRLLACITGAYTTLLNPSAPMKHDALISEEREQIETPQPSGITSGQDRKPLMEETFRAARVSLKKGDIQRGIHLLRECVWRCPESAQYQHHLGVILAEALRSPREAELHLKKALELDVSRVESYIALGKLYLKASLARRAEAQFLEALHWDSNNAEAMRLLSEARNMKPPPGLDKRH